MRVAIQWLAVVGVGTVLGSACSSSDRSMRPTELTFITPSVSAGSGGTEPNAATAGGGAESGGAESGGAESGGAENGGAAGVAGANELAGAGGADPCAGDYLCPQVAYWSHGIIKVDLPISVADAADAVFTACRNDECHSAKGSAAVHGVAFDFLDPDAHDGWVYTEKEDGFISLNFDDSGATPFAVLDWRFTQYGELIANDHYSLTIQPASASAATTLFDDQVNYGVVAADASLVSEGFCSHCSEVSLGTVDARAAP